MRFFTKTHTYEYDWETVTSAFWIKYPNERLSHVDGVHTTKMDYNPESQQLHTRRIMMVNYSIPGWIQKCIGMSGEGLGVEESLVDLKNKKLTMVSENVTMSSFFKVSEKCSFEPHPTNPNWTLFTQRAEYEVSGLGYITGALEAAACSGAQGKSQLGACTVEEIIKNKILPFWQEHKPKFESNEVVTCQGSASTSPAATLPQTN